MKNTKSALSLLAIMLVTLTFAACRKSNSPTDLLPPATHVGLNTMGCYVNGELFIPQEPALATHMYASARMVNQQPYALWLSWNDEIGSCGSNQLDIHVNDTLFAAGMTFHLTQAPLNPFDDSTLAQWGTYTRYPCQGLPVVYSTDAQVGGTLTVSYYDAFAGIVAGTFSFDVVSPGGDTLHIREGRFDMQTR